VAKAIKRPAQNGINSDLNAAAGFPVKELWVDAIKAGNFIMWPSLTTSAV
jgi:hypothetical protein